MQLRLPAPTKKKIGSGTGAPLKVAAPGGSSSGSATLIQSLVIHRLVIKKLTGSRGSWWSSSGSTTVSGVTLDRCCAPSPRLLLKENKISEFLKTDCESSKIRSNTYTSTVYVIKFGQCTNVNCILPRRCNAVFNISFER